ncbi:YitT family protein [Paraclostridium bifermentans]|nr:YitT family protein [Paraclostridium bifermentans]
MKTKNVLLVVVSKKQEVHLKKVIKNIDPSAFIIVSDVHEVLGQGFKSIA